MKKKWENLYFSPAHIASEARKYKSKLSSWEVEVIDPTYTLSQLETRPSLREVISLDII